MSLNLRVVIRAIDEATAPIRRINQAVRSITEPVRRVGRAAGALLRESGITALAGQVAAVGKGFGNVAREARAMALRVTAAVGMIGGGLFALVRGMANSGDEAVKAAQRYGVGIREMQRLGYAADLSGSNVQELGDSLRYLNDNATQAARGSAENQRIFRALGIEVRDSSGRIRSGGELIYEVADAFAAMEDGALKTHLAQRLFGDSGARMIPLLNLGAAGLREMGDEAEELGLVLDEDTARASEAFNDNLSRLFGALRGLRNMIGAELLPVFNEWVVVLTDALIAARPDIIEAFRRSLRGFLEALPGLIRGLRDVAAGLGTFLRAAWAILEPLGGLRTLAIALAAAIGAKLILAVVALGGAIAKLGLLLLATPVGWFLAAVAAIGGAVWMVYKNWDAITGYFQGLWADVRGVLTREVERWREAIAAFDPLADLRDAWGAVRSWLGGLDLARLLDGEVERWTEALRAFNPVSVIRETFAAVFAYIGGIDLGAALSRKVSEAIAAIVNVLPGWAREMLGIGEAGGPALGPSGPPLATAGPAAPAARQEIGGRLDIRIDAEGRPQVRRLESRSRDFDIEVDRGLMMGVP